MTTRSGCEHSLESECGCELSLEYRGPTKADGEEFHLRLHRGGKGVASAALSREQVARLEQVLRVTRAFAEAA